MFATETCINIQPHGKCGQRRTLYILLLLFSHSEATAATLHGALQPTCHIILFANLTIGTNSVIYLRLRIS
ncbi:MAG: hypothetical protein NXY57DRAFT_998082 [Lentinula lateritia]|nr:MAG: hypothetical protein NXY57DRAFT_998082 [Lentinula lateritia]